MASKYASLRGKIPEQPEPPSEKQQKIAEVQARYTDRSFLNLTAEFNRLQTTSDAAADNLKAINLELEAVERLIQEQLDAEGADSIRMNGYTWSGSCTPYPSAEDPAAIITYFKENGLEDQLTLKATELASRLKSFVKEEALANELVIEVKTFIDPNTGEESQYNDVRSHIPGVRVFLKNSLSRVKSGK